MGSAVKKAVGTLTGRSNVDNAANEAAGAMKQQQKYEQQALDYMKEVEKLPLELRNKALPALAGLYGIPGYEDTLNLTQKAQQSPIYQAMLGQIDQSLQMGEDQEGRNASVGGFLRSGVLADALSKRRAESGVAKAGALSSVYQNLLSGVSGLANQPLNTNAIAQQMGQIGQTRAQSIMIPSQMQMQGALDSKAMLWDLGKSAAMAFSDIRLKDNVEFIGHIGPHRWYSWKWNKFAEELGLQGDGEGVMAHEVQEYMPDAIGECDGYMIVNYDKLRVLN